MRVGGEIKITYLLTYLPAALLQIGRRMQSSKLVVKMRELHAMLIIIAAPLGECVFPLSKFEAGLICSWTVPLTDGSALLKLW